MKQLDPYKSLGFNLERGWTDFIQRYKRELSHRIIKNFLSEKEHYQLFEEFVYFPTNENMEKLNEAFRKFYIAVRLTYYLSKLLSHTSRDYYQRQKKRRHHCLLIFDQSASKNDSSDTIGELIASNEKDTMDKAIDKQNDLLEHIEDPALYYALSHLNERQLTILKLSLLNRFTNKQIGSILGISQQAVSKSHRQAIKKLSTMYKERASYGAG